MQIILKEISIENNHKISTNHYVNGSNVSPKINKIKIVKFDNDPGFYLLYFDKEGNELTDTYHTDLLNLLEQIRYEFGLTVQPDEIKI